MRAAFKVIYLVLAVPLQVAIGGIIVVGVFLVSSHFFGMRYGYLIAGGLAAILVLDLLNYVHEERFGRTLISWWRSRRSDWPLAGRFALLIAMWILFGFSVYLMWSLAPRT